MHPLLVERICCPECRGAAFEEFIFSSGPAGTRDGALVCRSCRSLFIVQDGILSLVRPALADISREMDFIERYAHHLPPDARTGRMNTLKAGSDGSSQTDWVLAEKKFWDEKKFRAASTKPPPYNWNRFEPRRRHILRFLPDDMRGRTVIEFGAGNAGTLFYLLNPLQKGYTHIVTDISRNALRAAQGHHPRSFFLQCDAVHPPFREASADVILDFGILHHLPDARVLERQALILKPGGWLGLHEPVNRRPGLLSSFPLLRKLSPRLSEHNEFLDERTALDFLQRSGTIVHSRHEYSPLRNWMIMLFVDALGGNNRMFYEAIACLDRLALLSLGRVWKRWGASSLLLVWRKAV